MTKDKKAEDSLELLKGEYIKLSKEYDLPNFDKMNSYFDLELIELSNTNLPLRRIRKQMLEKVYYYLRVFENLLNPANATIFVFSFVKSLDSSDQELIKRLYSDMSKFEIHSFGLEINYNKELEAQIIKEIYEFWEENCQVLDKLYLSFKENYKLDTKKQNKSYFG